MTEPRSPLLPWLQVGLFLFVLLLGLASVHSSATWLALRTGAWISEAHQLPSTDPFSYMTGGAQWKAHDWLADWLFYQIFSKIGPWGLVALKAALIAAGFALLLPLGAAMPLLAMGASALAACGAWPGFIETSAAFDFPCAALLLRWLVARPAFSVSLLWRVAALSLLWANLHPAGAWIGVAFAAVAAFRRGMAGTHAQRLGWLAVVATALLALWSNPESGGAWAAGEARTEWTVSPDLLNVYGLYLAAGVASAWVCLQEDFILAVSTMLLAALSLSRPAAAPLYLMAAAPLASIALSHFLVRVEPVRRRVAGLAALLVAILLSYAVHVTLPRGRVTGFTSRQTPEGALVFLEANRISGRMFNDLGSAPYLVWRGGPGRRVFADPRPGLYDAGVLADVRAWPERWPALSSTYRFDYAVVENSGGGYPARALDEDPGWTLAYFDDASLVYLRKGGANDAVLKHGSFRALRPNRWSDPVAEAAFSDPALRAAAIEEASRSLMYAPEATLGPLVRGYLLQRLGEPEKAERMRLLAREKGFWKPEHRGLEARILELRGDWAGASRAYRSAQVAAERAGDPLLASALGLRLAAGWAQRGQTRKARGLARRALSQDSGNAEAQALLKRL